MVTMREARENLRLTQEEVASYVGIDRHTYSMYEKNPESTKIGDAKKICYVLGIPISCFLLLVDGS